MPRRRKRELTGFDLQTETQFRSTVEDLATIHGWKYAYFPDSRHIKGDAGYPDTTFARNGEVIHAEFKKQSGRVSKDQREWLADIGATARLWRPSDIDAIEAELSAQRPPRHEHAWVMRLQPVEPTMLIECSVCGATDRVTVAGIIGSD